MSASAPEATQPGLLKGANVPWSPSASTQDAAASLSLYVHGALCPHVPMSYDTLKSYIRASPGPLASCRGRRLFSRSTFHAVPPVEPTSGPGRPAGPVFLASLGDKEIKTYKGAGPGDTPSWMTSLPEPRTSDSGPGPSTTEPWTASDQKPTAKAFRETRYSRGVPQPAGTRIRTHVWERVVPSWSWPN